MDKEGYDCWQRLDECPILHGHRVYESWATLGRGVPRLKARVFGVEEKWGPRFSFTPAWLSRNAGPPPDPGNGSANTWAEGWPPFPRRRLIACTRRARQLLDRCYRLSGLARGIKDSVSLFGCWNETEGWNSFVRPVVGILKFSDRAINRPFVRFPSWDIYVKEVFYDRTSNKSSFSPVDQSILCAICKSFLMNFLFLQVIYKYVDRTYTFNPKIQS